MSKTDIAVRTLHASVDLAPVGIGMSDLSGTLVYANAAYHRLHRAPLGALVGQRLDFAFAQPQQKADFWAMFYAIVRETREPSPYINSNTRQDGSEFIVRVDWDWVFVEGERMGMVAVARDITQEQQATKAIERALEDERILHHELLHRLKNNLQLMSSLLKLRFGATHPADVDALVRHFRSMGRVFEHLRMQSGRGIVQLDVYVERLVNDLFEAQRCALNLAFAPVEIDVDRAVAVGMCVAELATNACEHAYRDRPRGKVSVSSTISGGSLHLEVRDDGSWQTPASDSQTSHGLEIVKLLVHSQLGGHFTLNPTEHGTVARIRLPLVRKKRA